MAAPTKAAPLDSPLPPLHLESSLRLVAELWKRPDLIHRVAQVPSESRVHAALCGLAESHVGQETPALLNFPPPPPGLPGSEQGQRGLMGMCVHIPTSQWAKPR